MLISDFQNNPKLLALLLAHYTELDSLYDHCEKASNWDHEINDAKAHRAGILFQLELSYPDNSWDYIEYDATGECDSFAKVSDIPEGSGVIRVWTKGEFTEWWL